MPHTTDPESRDEKNIAPSPDNLAEKIIGVLAKISRKPEGDESPRLVEIASAQVAGISYSNIGDAGLAFLEDWASAGARARVPAFMNPCAMDTRRWRELGISEEYAEKQERIIAALEKMGVARSLTCAPYFGHFTPRRGQHLAWSESSAVSCANSLFGAMTNREGGPSALAAAICGKTALSGYHLPENRRPTVIVKVDYQPKNTFEFGSLGLMTGRLVEDGVPFFIFPDGAAASGLGANIDNFKSMAAGMAAGGAVALFHVRNLTPEADMMEARIDGLPVIPIAGPDEAFDPDLDAPCPIDVVALGCPHSSIAEIRRIAGQVAGRKLKTGFWICASRNVHDIAAAEGLKDIIEKSGARLLCDMCIVVAPLKELGIKSVATDSAKTAYYLNSRPNVGVRLGCLDDCIEAGLSGQWPGRRKDKFKPRMKEAVAVRSSGKPRPKGGIKGRMIVSGYARGKALCSGEPIGFFGNVNPHTGIITEPGHELQGQSVAGRILVFPRAKGSTVGSYVIYSLKKAGRAPLAIINENMEPIVAAGAAIAEIPAVDGIDTSLIEDGDEVEVIDGEVHIVRPGVS